MAIHTQSESDNALQSYGRLKFSKSEDRGSSVLGRRSVVNIHTACTDVIILLSPLRHGRYTQHARSKKNNGAPVSSRLLCN